MGSARLAVWASLVGPLYPHGHCGLARLAFRRLCCREVGGWFLCSAVGGQRALELALLRLAAWCGSVCRSTAALGTDPCNRSGVLAAQSPCCSVVGAVLGMGHVCLGAHVGRLAVKPPAPRLAEARHANSSHMTELLSDPQVWVAFLTLTALELVLGIDNVIFISILVDKLPHERRDYARRIGLFLAMFMRIALLFLLSWIIGLTEPIFSVLRQEISGRDLILIVGGLFLLWKSTKEIHQLLEGESGAASAAVRATFSAVIVQIAIIDLVFSFDSIITAVGMVDQVEVMVAAVILSVLLMMAFAGGIGRVVSAHPSIKMLALAFLLVIGVVLIADGFNHHIPKGYVYFALAFSVGVELLNIRMKKRAARPVKLHDSYTRERD